MDDHLALAESKRIAALKSAQENVKRAKQFQWSKFHLWNVGDLCLINSSTFRIVQISEHAITVQDGASMAQATFRNPHKLPQDEIDEIMREKNAGKSHVHIALTHRLTSSSLHQVIYSPSFKKKLTSKSKISLLQHTYGRDELERPAASHPLIAEQHDETPVTPINTAATTFSATEAAKASNAFVPPATEDKSSISIPRELAVSIHRDLFYLRFYQQFTYPGIDECLSKLGNALQQKTARS